MKKMSIMLCVITFLVGLASGLSLLYFYAPEVLAAQVQATVSPAGEHSYTAGEDAAQTPGKDAAGAAQAPALPMDALTLAPQILRNLQTENYTALAAYVHPEDGLTFVPYSTVEPGVNLSFTPQEIAGAAANTSKYIWGLQDGSGMPIELTMSDYFEKFVFDQDYTTAPNIAFNRVQQGGNSLENVKEAYPDSVFVEFNFPGIDPELQGIDWCSLKLVFSEYQGEWKLVALIHSQWTI